jgi:hypothetical protein
MLRSRYFPNGAKMRQLNTHGHYHLMAPSYDRAGTIGFRCAADVLQEKPMAEN